jgi:hypothetical protein
MSYGRRGIPSWGAHVKASSDGITNFSAPRKIFFLKSIVAAVQSIHRCPVLREFWREVEVELGRQYMTGSWGGLRNRLSNAGLTATMTYTTDLLGNPIGGLL